MKVKRGDKVRVISGSDKGKEGIVQKVFPKLNKVVVEGVNVHKKHKKPTTTPPHTRPISIKNSITGPAVQSGEANHLSLASVIIL